MSTPQQVPLAQSARKNRKIQRTLPQLKRNAACAPCRRRRIKCSGEKPACASCIRSFQFLARTQPDRERDEKGVQCIYEEEDGSEGEESPVAQVPEKRKMGSGSAEASGSSREDEVAAKRSSTGSHLDYLGMSQYILSCLTPIAPPSVKTEPLTDMFNPTSYGLSDLVYPSTDVENTYIPPYTSHTTPSGLYGVTGRTDNRTSFDAGAGDGTINPAGISNLLDAGAGELGGPFVDIFWPGWPKRLPTPGE
jgi:hypothetical protein